MNRRQEPFRGAWRASSFLASPALTAYRTSHRDRLRQHEKVECPHSSMVTLTTTSKGVRHDRCIRDISLRGQFR